MTTPDPRAIPLKCYLVDCDQDNGAQLYFAQTPGQAKRQCADEEGCDFTAVSSCIRRPRYDKYAPGPVPPAVLIEDGWWFECAECNRRVNDDMEETDENGEMLCPTSDERYPDYIWCSSACRDKDIAGREAKRARLAVAKAEVAALYPGSEIDHIWEAGDDKIRAMVIVPGLKYRVNWEQGSSTIGVHPDDIPAWQAYKASLKERTHA